MKLKSWEESDDNLDAGFEENIFSDASCQNEYDLRILRGKDFKVYKNFMEGLENVPLRRVRNNDR